MLGGILRKKACVLTNGCPENQLDSARVMAYLEENGWQIVDNVTDANIILFNACGLTESAELNSIQLFIILRNKQKIISN